MGLISDAFSIVFLNQQIATSLVSFIFLVAFLKIIFVIYEIARGD